eukprot:scaffold102444_cov32-Tisochrysis_lutea.AAC.6
MHGERGVECLSRRVCGSCRACIRYPFVKQERLFGHPLLIGPLSSHALLQLAIWHDALLLEVDQEHPARLKTRFCLDDRLIEVVKDSHLGMGAGFEG